MKVSYLNHQKIRDPYVYHAILPVKTKTFLNIKTLPVTLDRIFVDFVVVIELPDPLSYKVG